MQLGSASSSRLWNERRNFDGAMALRPHRVRASFDRLITLTRFSSPAAEEADAVFNRILEGILKNLESEEKL